MFNTNPPPPVNPAFANQHDDQPPAYTPAYNPGFVQPSAPPMSQPNEPSYNHGGFFGATHLNQEQLGSQMLSAVIMSKTEWVPKASLPSDTTFNNILGLIGGFFSSSIDPSNLEALDAKVKAKLWRQVGELSYAELLGDNQMIQLAERKTDAVFQTFISNITHDQKEPGHCFTTSLDHHVSPEALFDLGKLNFLAHNYQKAIDCFHEAEFHANTLESSSKYRTQSFKALMKNCAGAAQERLGFHDRALFEYIDAAKIDPNGAKPYQESLSRNFQILKFKPNKCNEELQACMEYDPYEPDFTIEFAYSKLNQGQYEAAMKLLNKSNEMAFYYKPQTLYRCVELAQQVAFAVNNAQGRYR